MKNSELFLEEFKKLEQKFETISGLKGNFISFSKSLSKIYCDKLNPIVLVSSNYEFLKSAADVRNLLSHNLNAVEPTDEFLKRFVDLSSEIQHPLKVLDMAIPVHNIVFADKNTMVCKLIKVMNERGITHVPVLSNGIVKGVFSRSTFFDYFARHKFIEFNESLTISDIMEVTSFSSHINELYKFVSKKTFVYQIVNYLTKKEKGKPKIGCIFITESGDSEEPLLGMLTQIDVIKESLEIIK